MESKLNFEPCEAEAPANIALVKYWGKRGGSSLNLPAVGSLSLSLEGLLTRTRVEPATQDSFRLDGDNATAEVARKVFDHLDLVWGAKQFADVAGSQDLRSRPPCAVTSVNDFPTAAGLASSASGFAALTLAAAGSWGFAPGLPMLSSLARQGSGSAARSLWGGWVRLDAGSDPEGQDCVARQLHRADHWDLRLIVAETARGPKKESSRGGMNRCAETSPYFSAWVQSHPADLDRAEAALEIRDLEALGNVMESSCFKMHACMMASSPPLLYWRGATLEAVHAIWDLRASGVGAWVTSDAGPHLKVLCEPGVAERVQSVLDEVPGVVSTRCCRPASEPRTFAVGTGSGE